MISPVLGDIFFWTFWLSFLGYLYTNSIIFKISYKYLSISLLNSIKIFGQHTDSQILDEIYFLYFWYTFLGCMYTNNFEFNVCLYSVSEYISFWKGHSWDVGTLVANNSEYLECLSDGLLPYKNYVRFEQLMIFLVILSVSQLIYLPIGYFCGSTSLTSSVVHTGPLPWCVYVWMISFLYDT